MDEAKARELVLVIPEARFTAAGRFEGFRPYSPEYMQVLLDPAYFSFRPRGEVETDPSFKQLIPYVILRCGTEVFHYTRGSSGTERRLQSFRSIGIGGHINPEDAAGTADHYRNGMLRELQEEVKINSGFKEHCLGTIFDGRSAVGEVHLGVVHVFDLEEPRVSPLEDAIHEAGFAPLTLLVRQRDQFETWSRFVMDQLADL